MTFDLQRVIESKRAYRHKQAKRPVEEKLAMLDELRDRTRAIRAAAARPEATAVRESPPEYHPPKD
jgi:hypothetical protein